MRIPTTITMLDYTGGSDDETSSRNLMDRVGGEARKLIPAGKTLTDGEWGRLAGPVFEKHLTAYGVTRYHNRLVPVAGAYITAARTATAAVNDANTAYDELSGRYVTNWHAAHHRYVLAATAALDALRTQLDTGRELADRAGNPPRGYDEAVPAENRIPTPDVAELEATLATYTLVNTDRFALLAATAGGSYPPGFEPQPDPTAEPAEAETDRWSGDRW
jgi:hypothetical protein